MFFKNVETIVSFIEKTADDSDAYRAVRILKSRGYDVYYSDGFFESNKSNITNEIKQAATMPDGKIIVSSDATIPAEEIADHEEVHAAGRLDRTEFIEYQSTICENICYESKAFLKIAEKINKDHNLIEIDPEKDLSDQLLEITALQKITDELIAYLRQCYNYNPDLAKEKYGAIFENWDDVAAAIEKFNQETSKADPSGPANFMPENSNPDNLSQSEADMVSVAPKLKKRRHTTAKEQSYIKGVGNDLGHRVIFEDMYQTLKNMGIEPSGNIPDGYIDEEGNVHIGFTVINPTGFVLKHELTHYGEGTDGYIDYIAAMRDTKLYKQWLQAETKSNSKSLGELEMLYRTKIRKSRGNMAPKGAAALNAEMYADFSGRFLFVASGFERLIKQINHKERPAAIQWVLDFFSYLIDKLSGKKNVTFELKRLESKYANMLREANKAEHTADNSGVKFSASNEAVVDLSNDNEIYSIKEQLANNQELLNSMELVAVFESPVKFNYNQEVVEWAVKQFEKINYIVEREGFGEIVFDKKRLKKGLSYLKTNEEKLAFAMLPDVLRKGVKISSHKNHKNRAYDTVTFAAPIMLNGVRGNMAVVVRQEDKNYYKVHRLLMPDGSQFVLDEKGDIAETAGGVDNNSSLSPTVNISNNNIPNPTEKVKKFSVPVLEDTDTESETDSVNVPAATRRMWKH